MTILAALRPRIFLSDQHENYVTQVKLIKKVLKRGCNGRSFLQRDAISASVFTISHAQGMRMVQNVVTVSTWTTDDPKTTTNAAPHAKRDGVQRTSNALRGAWAHATPGSMRCIAPRPAAALLCSGERIAAVSALTAADVGHSTPSYSMLVTGRASQCVLVSSALRKMAAFFPVPLARSWLAGWWYSSLP